MTVITEGSVLLEKTRELCATLAAQPAFHSIRERIDRFGGDADARQLLAQLDERGEQLQLRQQTGQPLTDAEIGEFESLRERFLSNPIASEFIAAREEMIELQETVAKHVAKTFELGRVPEVADFEGSCGTGCGCH